MHAVGTIVCPNCFCATGYFLQAVSAVSHVEYYRCANCDHVWSVQNVGPVCKDGEMFEWFREHAWKAIPATLTEQHRNLSSRNRFNDCPLQNVLDVTPETPVFVGGFDPSPYTGSTQFSDSSAATRFHLRHCSVPTSTVVGIQTCLATTQSAWLEPTP